MKYSELASPSATRAVLDRWDLGAKKSLGQNFLIDDSIVGKILDLSQVQQGSRVIEVGPGIGTLSVALLAKGAFLVAVEKDDDLLPVLAETTAQDSERFSLIHGDALGVPAEDFEAAFQGLVGGSAAPVSVAPASASPASAAPASVAPVPVSSVSLVANLPYAVAATLVLDYLDRLDFLSSATVMVQAEVAQRMMAQPGNKDYGAYTVKLALRAKATGSFPVSRTCFLPAPHVDSTVIRLDRLDAYPHELVEETSFLAEAAFAQRRKTIRNSMRSHFQSWGRDPKEVDCLLEQAGIDPGTRGETLSVQDFLRMGQLSCAQSRGCQ